MSIEFETHKSGHESFVDPEIREIIREIDFESLRTIFEEYASRSGIDPAEVNFIESAKIKSSKLSALTIGAYNVSTKELNLSEKGLQLGFKLDSESDKAARVLSTLIHEEAHAFGGDGHTEHEGDSLFGLLKNKWQTDRSGFIQVSKSESSLIDPTEKFRWFNEGVVDELASEVYTEYIRREGTQPLDEDKSMDFKDGYPLARLFVRSLRDRIAEESGVPSEVVWHSIIKLYAEGGDIVQGEVREALDEVFSEKFIDRLAGVSSSLSNPVKTASVFGEVLNKERVRSIAASLFVSR
jgi:hypothetical protein